MPRANKQVIRGATLVRGKRRALTGYQHIPADLRTASVATYSENTFGCALSGPFDSMYLRGSQLPALSVKPLSVFTPASTVC